MTVASYGGRKFSSIREAQVVGSPAVQSRSLIATGKPASRPSVWPARRRRSISSARAESGRRIDAQKGADLAVVLGDPVEQRLGDGRRWWFRRAPSWPKQFGGGVRSTERHRLGRHGSLAQDRGNQIEFGVVMRRVGQRLLGRQAGGDFVGRKTLAMSSAWAIGSTPSVFSSESCST